MIHGSSVRTSHRAVPDGGLALLVQSLGSDQTGQHRLPPSQRRAAREPQRTAQLLMSSLGAVILLAICGLTGFFIIAEVRRGHADAAGRTQPADSSAILVTRGADAIPLTLDEVFPSEVIQVAGAADPYQVRTRHIDTECSIAATGELGRILTDQGCSQVVRATMTAPYGRYQVTAGLFNLTDATSAEQVGNTARRLVESGTGTFAAMSGEGVPGTDPTHQPLAQVNWHEHGHYLLYAVIARPDGQVVHDDDPYAQQITVDLIETYLNGQVLAKRASHP
jgi:hypothetical protein